MTGKILNFEPSVRYMGKLRFYFYAKDAVQIDDGVNYIICNRWFVKKKGYYHDTWQPFIRGLCRKNTFETIWDVMDWSAKFEIDTCSAYKPMVDIPPNIKVRPERYIWA